MASAAKKRAVSFSNTLPSLLKVLLLLLALTHSVMAQTVTFNQLELDWIAKHPQISVGLDGRWPPIDFVNADGQPQGISSDIIQLIASHTGINFAPQSGEGWHDMLNKAQAYEIDIVATLAKNSEREKYWNFSLPYFKYPYVITTRKDENSLNTLESLDGKTVAIEKGYFLHQELINNHPHINLLVVDTSTQALQAVSRQQADAYVGNQTVIFYLIEQHRLTNLKVAADAGYPGGKIHFGVRKDWPELVSIINKVLANTAAITQIERKWLGINQLNQNIPSAIKFTPEEEKWLEQNKRLSIGVMQNWPPISEVTATGQLQGIDIDIVKQLNQRLNNRIHIEAGPWDNIYQDIKNKKLDLIMGITPQQYRSPFMEFSNPYLSVPHVIVARHDINEFYADEKSLAGKVIALEKDFVNVSYFRQNYPDVKIQTYENTLAALEAVSRGDADAYAGSRVVVLYLIEKQLLSNLKIQGRLSKPPTELAIGTRKDYPILASIIQKLLDDIYPSGVRQIVNKWIPLNTPADIEYKLNLSTAEQQWLDQQSGLSVGIMDNWPPFNFVNASAEPAGIGVDIIHELNLRLDNKISIVPGKWKQIYSQVENKKLDLIMDITPKPSREPFFNFTEPYLDIPHVIIAKRKNNIYRSEDDLGQKTLALEEGFGNVKYFQQKYPDVQIKLYPDTEQALEAVSRDEADAYAGNRVVALYLIDKLALSNLKVHGKLNKPGSILAIATRKDYLILRNILQKALDSMGEDKIREIKNHWLGQGLIDADAIPILKLTNEQQLWLQKHPVIRPGVDAKWKPLEYIDDQGIYQGLSSDFIKHFAQQLGVKLEAPAEIPWSGVLQGLREKNIDISPLLIKTAERSEYLNFTKPYLSFPVVIFNQRGTTLLGGLSDLAQKKVGVVEGYAIAELIQQDHPEIQQVKFKDTIEGLQALATGNIDAYIDVLSVGAYLIASNGMSNLQVAASTPYKHDFSIGVRKDWPELVTILNQAIDNLPIATKNQLLKKWLVVKYQKEIDYTLLSWVIMVALLIFTILSLRAREMARINAQLTEGRERLALTLESAELGTFELRFHKHSNTQFNYDEAFAAHHNIEQQLEFKDTSEFFKTISPEHTQMVRDRLTQYVKGEIDQFKVEYQIAGNQHWISTQGRIFERDNRGWAHRIIGISQDINERKQAQIAMERSSQFKSQFLANMSHEIRTPMNAIVGLGHLLLRSGLNKKQSEYLTNLQKSAKMLLGLIDDILDFSKIEAGHLSIEHITFNLEELLIDLSEMTALRMTQDNVEFIIDIGPKVPKNLIGDSFRLNQVLTNLVSNAIKFTEAGDIVLKVSLENHRQHQVSLLFSVSDTGIGIDKNNLATLFDPFIQEDGSTTRKYGGTGLGLSISKQLTQLMGGQLQAESEKGKGSRFFFSLPFKLAAHDGNKRLLSPPSTDLRGMSVLIADDNPTSLQILTDTLGSLNFKVSSVNSGDQAIQMLKQSSHKFDLLLIDWRMPDKDGIDTANEIKQSLSIEKMPLIILMTAYGKDLIEIDSDKFFLDGILIKPITPSSLFNAIIQAQKNTAEHRVSIKSDEVSPKEITGLVGEVILAEDNLINQQVALEILQQMGVDVFVCSNGIEVLDLLKTTTPDLILMDIQMPEMDGYETTKRIRSNKQFDDIPILAITANAMKEDIQKSIDAGMQGHISKPVDPEILYQTLSQYLDFTDSHKLLAQATEEQPQPASAEQSWPDSIAGLNIKRGIQQVGGNEQLYQKLLKDFLHNHEHLGQDLEKYIQQNDQQQATRSAHTLKGVTGNIGAERLYQASSEIDQKLKKGEPIESTLLNEFSSAFNELSKGIHQLQSRPNNEANTSATADREVELKKLLQSLHNNDANSGRLLKELSSELIPLIGAETMQRITQLVADFEFEQATAILAQNLQGKHNEH